MYCPQCGHQVEFGANFCFRCGAKTASARPLLPPVRALEDVLKDWGTLESFGELEQSERNYLRHMWRKLQQETATGVLAPETESFRDNILNYSFELDYLALALPLERERDYLYARDDKVYRLIRAGVSGARKEADEINRKLEDNHKKWWSLCVRDSVMGALWGELWFDAHDDRTGTRRAEAREQLERRRREIPPKSKQA